MSWHDYQVSKKIAAECHPFEALIMTAMRQADTANAAKIRAAWPGVAAELQARYDAPGGLLPDEVLATGTWTAGEPGSDD